MTGDVVQIPAQLPEERIDELPAELGLVVGVRGVGRKIFRETRDKIKNFPGIRHDEHPFRPKLTGFINRCIKTLKIKTPCPPGGTFTDAAADPVASESASPKGGFYSD